MALTFGSLFAGIGGFDLGVDRTANVPNNTLTIKIIGGSLRMIRCIFCKQDFSSMLALKGHSTTCAEHPAVQEVERLQSLICEIRMAVGLSRTCEEIDPRYAEADLIQRIIDGPKQ